MAQNTGNARNILVGASPLFLSVEDSTTSGYVENLVPGTAVTGAVGRITYNPSYGSVTVDQLLDTAKLFKETMEVMIATEMAEGTLENVLAVFGQSQATLTESGKKLGLAAGALGEAPVERQLVAIGQAPTTAASSKTERVYYARRVLSVQQSQFSLARNAASTFPVTFRLLPSGAAGDAGAEYGTIVDRTWL